MSKRTRQEAFTNVPNFGVKSVLKLKDNEVGIYKINTGPCDHAFPVVFKNETFNFYDQNNDSFYLEGVMNKLRKHTKFDVKYSQNVDVKDFDTPHSCHKYATKVYRKHMEMPEGGFDNMSF